MHLSQSDGERQRVLEKREGKVPSKWLMNVGFLALRSLLVHLLSAQEDDWQRIAGSGAVAGLCPISELIYERAPYLPIMLDKGIPVVLGTDCAASCDGADILAEAKFFALLAKMQGVEHDGMIADLMDMITRTPAQLFGFKDCGSIKVGNKADLVFIDQDLSLEPMTKPLVNLFFSSASRNVRHVMIDGEWILFDKELCRISEDQLR